MNDVQNGIIDSTLTDNPPTTTRLQNNTTLKDVQTYFFFSVILVTI